MNRRDFLRMLVLASVTAGMKLPSAYAKENVPLNPDLVAIFSDTHIPNDDSSQQVRRFNQCVQKILAMNPRPANLLIYGDIAYSVGRTEDYAKFRELIRPIEIAGIHWEVTMGNHDRIENYRQIFPERFREKPFLENRSIHIVETPKADFILLDSYLKNEVRGEIDSAQKAWLAETVRKYSDKPFFVGCHHPLRETKIEDILKSSPSFAAYVHGHNHWWTNTAKQEIPTLCFPSTGHWGDMGFVMVHLTENDAAFVPDIDAYLFPTWSKKTAPVINLETYLKMLNETTVTIPFPKSV